MHVLNIAHRGGAALMPENSCAAFRDAIARGADGAELDVQLSRDGAVIVHHDYRLNPGYCRSPDGRWIDAPGPPVKELALAELRAFDIGRADPASEYARGHPGQRSVDGERIPLLEEVIAAAKQSPSFILLIELKSDPREPGLSADTAALAEAALDVVLETGFLERSIFVGFDWPGLLRVKQLHPRARCWFSTAKLHGMTHGAVLEAICAAGGDGWFPDFRDLSAAAIAGAHAFGLQIAAWTVNDPAVMKALAGQGIDAICTDRPDLMVRR